MKIINKLKILMSHALENSWIEMFLNSYTFISSKHQSKFYFIFELMNLHTLSYSFKSPTPCMNLVLYSYTYHDDILNM